MSESIRIYLTCDRHGQRGSLYTARLNSPNGEVLVSGTTEPALDAARVLKGRGRDPAAILEMWDAEHRFPRLTGVLGVMAGQTVLEGRDRSGLQFGKYLPFQDAVSRASVEVSSGVPVSSGTQIASDEETPVRNDGEQSADPAGEAQS